MKKIYLIFSLLLASLLLLSIIWEFFLEDYLFSLLNNDDKAEPFDEKIKYIITIFCFGLISLIGPLYISLNSEKRRINLEAEREMLISELEDTLKKIKQLQGIIPICSYCHSIRNDEGAWDHLESYISNHSEASFSHGICPKCTEIVRKDSGLDDE